MKFPRYHIAESVVNRILNAHDEIEAGSRAELAAARAASPVPPDPTLEGATLDVKLNQPPAPAAPDQAALASTAQGGDALGGLIRETVP